MGGMTATRWNPDLFLDAWGFAARQHRGQTYGGHAEGERVEYLAHLGAVVAEVALALQSDLSADGDLAMRCAALHDAIEDTGATHAQLALRFGPAVADGVLALSKDAALPDKRAQMDDSLRRIRSQPREVWMVKLADRIANLEAPPFYWDAARIAAYREEARVIHHALHPASDALAARLQGRIEAYGRFARSA